MEKKQKFIFTICANLIFASLVFFLPQSAKANYTASSRMINQTKFDIPLYSGLRTYCSGISGGKLGVTVTCYGSAYGTISDKAGSLTAWIFRNGSAGMVGAKQDPEKIVGYVSRSSSFSNSRDVNYGDVGGFVGYASTANFSGATSLGLFYNYVSNNQPHAMKNIYIAPSPGWYLGSIEYYCPSGGSLLGTTCVVATDNGCAANTCSATSCWNNLAWVNGTKTCNVDNGCAANTCSNTGCFNSFAWVTGTKACDNGCAANTCTGMTCDNSITIVNGTKTTAECATPTGFTHSCANDGRTLNLNWNSMPGAAFYYVRIDDTTDGFWPNAATDTSTGAYASNSFSRAITPGTTYNAWIHSGGGANWSPAASINGIRCSNNCAANTCQTSNTGMLTTCNNGIIPNAPGTKLPIQYDQCGSTPITCTRAQCGLTIPTATNTCSRLDSTNCLNPTSCLGSCPTPATQVCPVCPVPVSGTNWKEVSP